MSLKRNERCSIGWGHMVGSNPEPHLARLMLISEPRTGPTAALYITVIRKSRVTSLSRQEAMASWKVGVIFLNNNHIRHPSQGSLGSQTVLTLEFHMVLEGNPFEGNPKAQPLSCVSREYFGARPVCELNRELEMPLCVFCALLGLPVLHQSNNHCWFVPSC